MRHIKLFISGLILALLVSGAQVCWADSQETAQIMHGFTLSDDSLVRLGDHALAEGDDKKAIGYYLQVCQRQQPAPAAPKKWRVAAWRNVGKVLYSHGNYAEALIYFLRALNESEKDTEKPFLAELYKLVGNTYGNFHEYDKAKQYFLSALGHTTGKDAELEKYYLYLNLVTISDLTKDAKAARKYYELSLKMRHPATPDLRFMDQYNHARVLKSEGNTAQAITILKRLGQWASDSIGDKQYACSAYEDLYKCYSQLNQADSAFGYMTKCNNIATQNNILHLIPQVLDDLGNYYSQHGNSKLALEYKQRYWNLVDSTNLSKHAAAQKQMFAFEVNRYSSMIDSLQVKHVQNQQTISEQRDIITWVVLATLVVSALLFYTFRQNRKLKASYQHLFQFNEKLVKEKSEPADAQPQPAHSESQGEKYKNSTLKETQSQHLASQITQVMEQTQAYCSPDFSLDTLASMVQSNRNYVSQVINEVFGCNFNSYVSGFRVDMARRRLSDTASYGHLTIKAIGESVGFKSQTTFTNTFRKITGITPAMYQKMALQETAEAATV